MDTVIYKKDTLFNKIKVVEEGNILKLLSGSGPAKEQSAIDVTDLDLHVFDYSLIEMHSFLFVNEPKNILVIGFGGGIVVREMIKYFPNVNIDVMEIDQEMIDVAEKYFYFKNNGRVRFIVGDAFDTIDKEDEKYDIVILDAFNSNYTPFHLMSIEFLNKIRARLNNKYVLAINVCKEYVGYKSQLNTIISALGDNIYEINGTRNKLSCVLFVTNEDLVPLNADNILSHFLIFNPEKSIITDEIRDAKIYSMANMMEHKNVN